MKFSNRSVVILAVTIILIAGFFTGFYLYHKKVVLQSNLVPTTNDFHYSYFSQKSFFDDGYARAKTNIAEPEAKAIMVNHHLLAPEFIAESFNAVATNAPLTVLLISPNHFDAGKSDIITSAEPWQTPYGILQPDLSLAQKLSNLQLASIEENPFIKEHGVSGIVSFIKKSLPNAKVVPVIFRNRMTLAQSITAADQYYKNLPPNVLIVGSFDFSHYLPSRAADFHDVDNLATVEAFDFSKIYKLDMNSRPGLAFYLELLKDYGYQNFNLLENSNSAKLVRRDILETTSYIDGYYTKGSASTTQADTLLILPSVVPSAEVLPILDSRGSQYGLAYLERLFYGQDSTLMFLLKPDSISQSVFTRLGARIISQNNFEAHLGPVLVALIDCHSGMASQIQAEIDKGSDVVICQGASKSYVEFYKNKPIIYASGNLFDQSALKNGATSLAVGLAFQNHQLKITLLPIGNDNGQLKLLIGGNNDKILAEIANNSSVPLSFRNQIKMGVITINNFK